MPVGRYKNVASRFRQWRILPADCKSWLERRGDDAPGGAEPTGGASSAAAVSSAAAAATAAAGRMSGDLPENVTEERLYQSRLYDLARERHKMIQESDYVRNQFIDHQMRKARSKNLCRLLQGLDIEQYRSKSASGVERNHQRSAHARRLILASRVLGQSIDELSKFTEEELRVRLSSEPAHPATAPPCAQANEAPMGDAAVPNLPGEGATNPEPTADEAGAPSAPSQQQPPMQLLRPLTSRTSVHVGWPDSSNITTTITKTTPLNLWGGSVARRGSGRPATTSASAPVSAAASAANPGASGVMLPRMYASGSIGGVGGGTADQRGYRRQSSGQQQARSGTSGQATSATATPWQQQQQSAATDRRPRTASARRRVQSDPRCVQLINILTPRYKPSAKTPDVGAIIRANPSLCQPAEQPDSQEVALRQSRQKAAKGKRTRRELLEMLDGLARSRYYETKNLATLS